jgi:hypothetical protein
MRVLIMRKIIKLAPHLNPPLLRFYSGQAPVGEEIINVFFPLDGGRLKMGGDCHMGKTKAREVRKNPTDAERKLWIYPQRR